VTEAEQQAGEPERPRRSSNQGFGTFEDNKLHWRRFDELPAELRRVYDLAPFRMHMGRAHKRLAVYAKHGADTAKMRKAEIFFLAKHLQEKAAETYGPDHPDAQRNRLEGRARRTLHAGAAGGGRA
jgi:hypothetical protein